MNRARMSVTVIALSALVASGCSSEQEVSKPGGDPVPISLRIGTDDEPGRPAADQIEEFARQVNQISNGQITIVPVWNANGSEQRSWDQLVARMVVKGDLDMGLIPARAWDTEGVTSMRALQAPFLITSEELAKQVVGADFVGEMLSGLDQVGVHGLALFPESLRQIFSFGQPVLSPADLKGMVVRAPRSDATAALFQSLGATADDVGGSEFESGVADGTVGAAESQIGLAQGLPRPGTVTGNVVLFPKFNSLVVNSGKFAALTDVQQHALQEAAAETREWAVGSMSSTAEGGQQYCQFGGSVVATSEENLRAFQAAAQSVHADLEKDPQTRTLIERIRTLNPSLPPTSTPPCAPGIASSTAATPDRATTSDEPTSPMASTGP